MSVEANEGAVRRHIDLSWNQAEFDALAEVWSLDAVVRTAVLAWTDRHCEIEALVGEGNLDAN